MTNSTEKLVWIGSTSVVGADLATTPETVVRVSHDLFAEGKCGTRESTRCGMKSASVSLKPEPILHLDSATRICPIKLQAVYEAVAYTFNTHLTFHLSWWHDL